MSVIDLLKELISIPSMLDNTTEIEDFTADVLRQTADPRFIEDEGKGRNVMASAVNDPSKPTILLNGHLDTVNVCGGWTREPFEPVVEGDRLYGLGAVDMKAGIALGLTIFGEMAGSGHNVIYTGSIDEERDSAGAFALIDSGIEADLCFVQEPTYEKVVLGCRGRYVIDVAVGGQSAHGATPEKGVNAVVEAGRLVSNLELVTVREHELLGKGSLCVLDMHGGTPTLSVPETCHIKIDRHVVPGDTADSVVTEIRELAQKLNSRADFDIYLNRERPTPFLEAFVTPKSALVSKFMEVSGAEVIYGRSVGDYNAFAKEFPTLVFGPYGENWHMADEWVSISSIDRCLEVYRKFFASL